MAACGSESPIKSKPCLLRNASLKQKVWQTTQTSSNLRSQSPMSIASMSDRPHSGIFQLPLERHCKTLSSALSHFDEEPSFQSFCIITFKFLDENKNPHRKYTQLQDGVFCRQFLEYTHTHYLPDSQ